MDQPVAMMPTVRPPRWAEAVLGLLVRREDVDSVTGDLLEEYRESRVPAVGVRQANRWYVAQVARAAWRLAAIFCVTAALLHAWREGVDELVPVASYYTRSLILSYGMIAIYASAGIWAGWRTGRIAAGTLTATLTSLIGWSGAWIVAASLPLLGVRDRLYPGGIDEMFLLPFMMLPLVVTLGTLGALGGRIARRLAPTRRAG